jgi:hypothetical protein
MSDTALAVAQPQRQPEALAACLRKMLGLPLRPTAAAEWPFWFGVSETTHETLSPSVRPRQAVGIGQPRSSAGRCLEDPQSPLHVANLDYLDEALDKPSQLYPFVRQEIARGHRSTAGSLEV